MKKRPKFVHCQRTSTLEVRQCLAVQLMSKTDGLKKLQGRNEVTFRCSVQFPRYYAKNQLQPNAFDMI